MANNAASYKRFVGLRYSDLNYPEQAQVLNGQWERYLRIEPGTRIVRAVPQPDPVLPVHNGRFWA